MAPEAQIPLEMLLVFGAAKVFEEVFERLRQPGIVGQIFAGIVLGPALLGWVRPDSFLAALAELGVMFLLFRVGLSTRSSDLIKVGGTAMAVAVIGVVVPFGMGWAIFSLAGEPQIEAIFIGAAMVATSVGITAQVLAAAGLLEARASRIILAAAVIDDVLGLLVLAAVSGIARGGVHVLDLAFTALLAIGFVALMARWGTATLRRVVPHAQGSMRIVEGEFALGMIVLFGLSLLGVYMGVAPIIGAFLGGMALAESASPRLHDLTLGVSELLVPFFLVGIGLHFSFASFAGRRALVLGVLIVIAAIVSKFAGCALGAIRLGRADAVRVGVGMVPRGEVGMVVAQIGLTLGVISAQAYDITVAMAVLTTVIAPPLLTRAFRHAERTATPAP